MRIALLAFLFSVISTTTCLSQKVTATIFMESLKSKPDSDTLYYDLQRKLTWADFRGKPDPNSPGGAVTASGFAFHSNITDDGKEIKLIIGVHCFFTKHDSWRKPNIHSDYHLEHEQRHFDITRLGAQKLVEALQKANFTKENFHALLTTIFNKVYNENTALQEQYDRETRNSLDVKKQEKWNERIREEIAKLSNY